MRLIEQPKPLSKDLTLTCFSCRTAPASHACRFEWDGTMVQACLCPNCMTFDTTLLVENVLGYRKEERQEFGHLALAA
ncbi:MAG: hypothetical protein JW883_06210 [Deltaproteobacteria bacterium]|nr:hypothetical protein [Deltaproteobacteria bacterium]